MLWLSFLAFGESEYINITLKNVVKYIGRSRPCIAKFYSDHCYLCQMMAGDYSEASTMFPNVYFGGINCAEEVDVCEQFEIRACPTVLFFPPFQRKPSDFEGEHTTADFVRFIEKRTRTKAGPSYVHKLRELNPLTFQKFADNLTCGLMLYTFDRCGECPHLQPQFGLLTHIFEGDSNVSIGTMNCNRFENFCRNLSVPDTTFHGDATPVIKYYINGTWFDYGGSNITRDLVALMNEKCGTDRGLDGLLSDAAGTIAAADKIAKAFADALNREELIRQMKAIGGAAVYLKAMERIEEKGIDQIRNDTAVMRRNLDARAGGMALDGMKRRYNVFMKFLPAPTPVCRIKKKGQKKTPSSDQDL
jgi:hypothetical protein